MIKLVNKSSEKVSFKTDMPISLLNAIRRSVNYVPILAIDSLEISKNDSALYDEIIAHRLGLVPLKNEDLKLASECDCGKCSMKLKMSVVGPTTVYSDQLNPKGVAVYKMPITILDKDQELEFVAIAKMGLGVKHAKFDPGVLYYKYSADSKSIDDAQFNKLIEETKKQVNQELDVSVESWGQMPAKEIFTGAIDALNKELKSLVKQVK